MSERKTAVFLSHLTFESPFRVGSHQLVKALDHKGWRVLHVPIPVTPVHVPLSTWNPAYRKRVAGAITPKGVYERAIEIVPFSLIPWQLSRLAGERATYIYAASQPYFSTRVNEYGFSEPDILFIDEPRLSGMAKYFAPKRTIYRAVDLYSEMMDDVSVRTAENNALDLADGFIATSQPVFDRLKIVRPEKSGLLLENGVELDRFQSPNAEPADLAKIPRPRAIYVGDMDKRFDDEAILELARARPNVSIVLIGPPSKKLALATEANIFALGVRPYEEIAAYLQHADVGLLPLSPHPANRGRSPMKIYEYGAAGLPVIATSTEEMVRRNLPYVALYETREELPALLDQSLADRESLSEKAIAAAGLRSWASRVEAILEFCATLSVSDSRHCYV